MKSYGNYNRNHQNRNGNSSEYSQGEIHFILSKSFEFYKKDEILSIVKSAIKKGNNLRIDGYISKINQYLETTAESFSSRDLSKFLYLLCVISIPVDELSRLISSITRHLSVSNQPFTVIDVSMTFFGLKTLSCDNLEVRHLLNALTMHLRNSKVSLDSQAIGNVLYGLQNMSSDYDEVCQLIQVLCPKIQSCNQCLRAQEVGNALYGLQNMSSDKKEVRQLLNALEPNIYSCNEPLTAQAVSNALYGIRNMKSCCKEVRSLLKVLIPKIDTCHETFRAQAVGNALYGLNNMKSDYGEVIYLLQVLIPKISSCRDYLQDQHILNSCYGLRNMSSNLIPVRELLRVLTYQIYNCPQVLSGNTALHAVNSLQSMNYKHAEVRDMIITILRKVDIRLEPINIQCTIESLLANLSIVDTPDRSVGFSLDHNAPTFVLKSPDSFSLSPTSSNPHTPAQSSRSVVEPTSLKQSVPITLILPPAITQEDDDSSEEIYNNFLLKKGIDATPRSVGRLTYREDDTSTSVNSSPPGSVHSSRSINVSTDSWNQSRPSMYSNRSADTNMSDLVSQVSFEGYEQDNWLQSSKHAVLTTATSSIGVFNFYDDYGPSVTSGHSRSVLGADYDAGLSSLIGNMDEMLHIDEYTAVSMSHLFSREQRQNVPPGF